MSASEAADLQLTVRLPWQGDQWQRLEALHGSDRLPHALLLSGEKGIGKRRFALALAQYLMCEQPVSGTACGNCRQCSFNRAGTHPDLKLVSPDEPGKQIKVDQIRELVQFLTHTSQQGGYKVAVIQPAEAMNANAANALLKSLEEPAGDTLLILIANAASGLLPTIRSRCQTVLFPLPALALSREWLVSVLGSANQADELLHEAAGQPMTALELLQGDGLARLKQLDEDYIAMLEGRVGALTIAEKWLDYDLAEVLTWLSQRLSSLIAAAVAGSAVRAAWVQLGERASPRALYEILDSVNQLNAQLARGANPNRQLALETLLLASCDKFHRESRS